MQTSSIEVAQHIAALLLSIDAVRLSPQKPFQWSSGWHSPIYCDNRLALSYPHVRTDVKNALAEAIKTHFGGAEVIAGVATAGIPQGALVADTLALPYIYVRPEPKSHGMGNQIEGRLLAGQKVVVIEDLISTGGSSLKVVDVLRQAGADVLGMAAIFTYGFEIAAENFRQKNVPLICLSNYDCLIKEAIKLDYADASELETLTQWRANPAEWGS
ncbi:MAG: orotate phosphoribosyltransferase [Runella slithyformis]|nr:MAG: orotate phosphoribosyltransferase [Runella slithyformis]TAF92947.1 MAG: orotate phosphoribosyltransferase [Runella sp.]TAG23178.1 MAG: orotate phosphoribosyltransferase [Cytophagales bacterium]TAG42415.1 MAG: orotate phosphoribosyltransferase [Cytophagia bacterium]TAE97051.1 MAG: orotate phosphoribosyltransferase [Runella slithyformis]